MHTLETCCYFPHAPGMAYDWPGRPRRMAVNERALWNTYRAAHPDAADEVWYDAQIPRRVGDHIHPPTLAETYEAAMTRGWAQLTCLRADVIARKGTTYRVIEVHRQTREGEYGRLLRYDWLARELWPALKWGRPLLITDSIPVWPVNTGDWSRVDVWTTDGMQGAGLMR